MTDPLTEAERGHVDDAKWRADDFGFAAWVHISRLLVIIDRLSAAPVGLTEDERKWQNAYEVQTERCEKKIRELRAEVDRLSAAPRAEREALERIADLMPRKAHLAPDIARDALAALPAPEPTLTGEETVNWYGLLRSAAAILPEVETPERLLVAARNLAADIDAALAPYPTSFYLPSAAPVPEGVPEDHRVCSHGIYHHGCPSCDRQDPEDR